MAPLLLVRHGQSEGNAAGVIQGRLDPPLTPLGREQARALAGRLRAEGGVDRIVASPLARARATAEAVAAALGLPLLEEPRLMEYDFGEASGLTPAAVRERHPEWSGGRGDGAERPLLPGEEGVRAFDARVAAVVDDLLALEGRTVAVAHGGVITTALNLAFGQRGAPLRFRMENCAIAEFARDASGRIVVQRQNDDCHLRAPADDRVDA